MRLSLKTVLVAVLVFLSLAGSVAAQAGRNRQKTSDPQKKAERPVNPPTEEQKNEGRAEEQQQQTEPSADGQDVETVKVETNLVTVPVIASDRGDRYIPDLKQEDFTIFEDGVKQEISFFETVTAPFHLVLMIDTSASTQDKLGQIQQAAIAFTEQLQKADRVKVMSFADSVRDLSDFTSDRAVLQWAIRGTRPGQGTKLYDAMAVGLKALQKVKGRKAIVIFTDGVDSYSDRESYDRNRRMIEEAGIIIYPIRYDTRDDVERLVRGQQQSGQVIDLASILGGKTSTGTTPTTFPGGTTIPSGRTGGGIGTSLPRLPGGVVITSSRNGRDRDDNRYPPNDPRNNDPTNPSSRTGPNDTIGVELDALYRTADAYLAEIAEKSGGRLHRADTLGSLPVAFKQIADELRTQYSLGYYPPNQERDGKYRKIKVKTSRKDVAVRARPGYRTPSSEK
ncbi:MAG: VWA domain-containing protein [Acidobacteria bacterium]|nr:VWA domain-containing protein [Acidobacteriota bacterium]